MALTRKKERTFKKCIYNTLTLQAFFRLIAAAKREEAVPVGSDDIFSRLTTKPDWDPNWLIIGR
jgi:hypothetical protein